MISLGILKKRKSQQAPIKQARRNEIWKMPNKISLIFIQFLDYIFPKPKKKVNILITNYFFTGRVYEQQNLFIEWNQSANDGIVYDFDGVW